MIYHEGKTPWNWVTENGDVSYESTITVIPHRKYELVVEVLRNDLGGAHEKVADVKINGISLGECDPDGNDLDCTFYNCTSSWNKSTIVYNTTFVKVFLHFVGHSRDCDCNTTTWECLKEYENPNLTPVLAVARITLTPVYGAYFANIGK